MNAWIYNIEHKLTRPHIHSIHSIFTDDPILYLKYQFNTDHFIIQHNFTPREIRRLTLPRNWIVA